MSTDADGSNQVDITFGVLAEPCLQSCAASLRASFSISFCDWLFTLRGKTSCQTCPSGFACGGTPLAVAAVGSM